MKCPNASGQRLVTRPFYALLAQRVFQPGGRVGFPALRQFGPGEAITPLPRSENPYGEDVTLFDGGGYFYHVATEEFEGCTRPVPNSPG